MVILDGKPVDKKEITPEKHRFIGTFRWADPVKAYELADEEAKHIGLYPHQVREYWARGDFDCPQYVSIQVV